MEPDSERNGGEPLSPHPDRQQPDPNSLDHQGLDQQVFNAGTARKATPGKRRWLRIGIAAVLAIIGIFLVQSLARETDHQVANLVTASLAGVAAAYVLIQLVWIAAAAGQVWWVPAGCVALLATFVTLFRFDGFSGELVPQFKLRFVSNVPKMRSLEQSGDSEGRDGDQTTSGEVTPASHALVDSLGFLGTSRTGVVAERLFSVPKDAAEIQRLWNIGLGEGWSSFSVVADRAITLEQRNEQECLTCYRLADGELLWMVAHEATHGDPMGGTGPRSTPTIQGQRVYAQGATGKLWCADWNTGQVLWNADLLELAGWDQETSETAIRWGRAGSPLLIDGLCVVPFGGPESMATSGRSLIAFDADSGEIRWTAGRDQISFASPGLMNLVGQRQIVSVNEQTITGHRIEDGSVLWEFEWFGQSNGGANCAMAVPAGDDQFLIGKGYGGGSALVRIEKSAEDSLMATAVWESSRVLKTKFTHACVDRDIAYAISNGSLEAVWIPEGEQQWVQPRGERLGQGQILLVEDTIVGQAESGEVVFVAVNRDEYQPLLRLPAMESKTWNIPTVAGRHLLVRNDRQAFCFLLPPRDGSFDRGSD